MGESFCARRERRGEPKNSGGAVERNPAEPQRMIQSGHLKKQQHLTALRLSAIAEAAIERLDVGQARREVEPFVKDP